MSYRHEIIKCSKQFPIIYIIHDDVQATVIRHWHDGLELSFTINGYIDLFYISGKTYKTKEKDILLINPNEVHSVSVAKNNTNLALTLIFPFEFMKSEFKKIDSIYFTLNEKEKFTNQQEKSYRELQNLMEEFSNIIMKRKGDADFIELKAIMYKIFYILIKDFSIEKNITSINNEKYIDRLSDITRYIDANYMKRITPSDLSREFYLSVAYLSRFFKKHMGLSIHEYVTLVRLNYAHDLLLNTYGSIHYIAEQTGFPNDKAFTVAFKRVYKETPYQYRKSHKKTFF